MGKWTRAWNYAPRTSWWELSTGAGMAFRTPSDRQRVSVGIWWAIGHESSNESGSDSGSDDQYTSNYSHIFAFITMSFRRWQLAACFVWINFRLDIKFAFRHIAKHVTASLWITIFILYLINWIKNQSYITLHATQFRSGSCGAFHPRTPSRAALAWHPHDHPNRGDPILPRLALPSDEEWGVFCAPWPHPILVCILGCVKACNLILANTLAIPFFVAWLRRLSYYFLASLPCWPSPFQPPWTALLITLLI